ncbi:Leucine-rich repeat-containing protein [Artemisia annua]|uniref:Leucine-rich repeat-containing protein n=1 Tax=Artemisia annua TaxID=35608 RepID=A0A2U1N1L4_ARTAN|nr:Leucine-rich repeat-containing protein [Artemisia annua]
MSYSKVFIIFFLFFCFTAFASSTSLNNNNHKCPKKQRDALLLFKHTLSSINYPIDVCSGPDYHPSDIPLKIPVNLTHLTRLDISHNQLNGTLPSWLFTSPSLEFLDLSFNMFTGDILLKIPVNLTHLTSLDLSDNNLNGTLPSWLFTSPSLEYLYLYDNMLSGNVPFESFTSPSLKYLSLTNNQLGGQIDVQTFPQLTNLTSLDLSQNNFSGELELDTLLSTLTNLTSLDLSYSGFSVTTNNANHFVNPGFRYLYLASCKLKVFPNSLRAMKRLRYLDLSSNEIHGQIPHWAGEIGGNHLYYLNLSHNFITALPQFQWYGLQQLYLQSNLIEGPFPPSICNMSTLYYLDMSNNRFGGLIPQCFGNISSSLATIDMGNNSFQGTIPNVYGDCGSLEGLILKGNQLEGCIPEGPQFSTFSISFGGNSGLYGFPLPNREHQSSPQAISCYQPRPNWLNGIADAEENMILKRRNKRRSVSMGK